MNRNIQNWKKQGEEIMKMNERRDFSVGEFRQFLDNFKQVESEKGTFDAVWDTMGTAFLFGVAVGARCESRRKAR